MSATFLTDLELNAFLGFTYSGTITSDTTTNGSAVDCALSDGVIHLVGIVGNYGDASTQAVVKLQESDTSGGTYTDISGATTTLAASATANDNSVFAVQAIYRSKQYVRGVVVTSGGGTPSVPIALAVVGRKKITGSGTGTVT